MKISEQMKKWMGDFGDDYTARNSRSLNEVDEIWRSKRGISRSELNNLFFGPLDRSITILEVGSNIGNQLLFLRKMGFKHLFGIDINENAIRKARENNLEVIYGSAMDIPLKDASFDLVFTSTLLIHIPPHRIGRVLREIHRCSKMYIQGYEFLSAVCTPVTYRGELDLLWKRDFVKLYQNQFKDLRLLHYLEVPEFEGKTNKRNSMFLLRKEEGETH